MEPLGVKDRREAMVVKDAWESRKALLADASEMVVLHKVIAARQVLASLETLTEEQFRRCLAFELGLTEYYFDHVLKSDDEPRSPDDPTFLGFLRYHADREYADNANSVYDLWVSMVREGTLTEVRRLGAESASQGTSSDGMHRPLERAKNYFRLALGN